MIRSVLGASSPSGCALRSGVIKVAPKSSVRHIPFSRFGAQHNTYRSYQQGQQRFYQRQAFNYNRYQSSQNIFRRWAARPTFYYEVGGIAGAGGIFYVANLETVPVSGRRRFNIVSPETELQVGVESYNQTLQEYRGRIYGPNTREHQLVQRVLNRLLPHSGLAPEGWEVHVIQDDQQNAFVVPGGKVFVFSGLLKICRDEDSLAAVLGHEIAHNVAHHMAERLSQGGILSVLPWVVFFTLGIDPGITRLGSNLLLSLPHSRAQEREADYIGLLMMAEACYDPQAAVKLWQRMEQEVGAGSPQFLSTHPSGSNRIQKITEWLPEAESKRAESECGNTSAYLTDFRNVVDIRRW